VRERRNITKQSVLVLLVGLTAVLVPIFGRIWKANAERGGQQPAEPFRIAGNFYRKFVARATAKNPVDRSSTPMATAPTSTPQRRNSAAALCINPPRGSYEGPSCQVRSSTFAARQTSTSDRVVCCRAVR
jgi:hypothetical protein